MPLLTTQGLLTADAYAMDLTTCAWTKLAPHTNRAFGRGAPSQPRIHHCATAAPGGAGVVVLGGAAAWQGAWLVKCSVSVILCRLAVCTEAGTLRQGQPDSNAVLVHIA